MTARRARLPRRLRPLVKPLLGALLALIGVLAPIEPPDLAPFDDVVGAQPASAQSTVVLVEADDCPEDPEDTRPWVVDNDDESLCVLIEPDCPEHPLAGLHPVLAGTYLTDSTDFPDFCEATVREADNAAMYGDCAALTGAAIIVTGTLPDRECRIVQVAQCAPQLHRVGHDTCRGVQRRNWSCDPGELPRNQFATCYRPPTGHTGPSPCDAGAPDFPIVTCDEYVGSDFVPDPTDPSVACGSAFRTGDTRSMLQIHTANRYWCRYDTSHLDVACYASVPPCPVSWAYCIKRASRTGGCDRVAETLRCRALQADPTVPAEDLYQEGCTPCVVLPFAAVSAECPAELHAQPRRVGIHHASYLQYEWAHTYKGDFLNQHRQCATAVPPPGCRDPLPACADPPRGRLTWQSNHHSGLAVINSPVTLRVLDTVTQARQVHWIENTRTTHAALFTRTGRRYEYPGGSPGDPIIRTWHRTDASRRNSSVSGLASGGECYLRDLPQYRILVEELWPDNDAAAITALFGDDALNWWGALTGDQQLSYTEARGLEHITVRMPQDQLDDELARRLDILNDEIVCNHGRDVWCRWEPARPGYYRLTAAGGWALHSYSGFKSWMQAHQLVPLQNFLGGSRFRAGDGDCDETYGSRRGGDYDCIMQHLDLMQMTKAQIGLAHDDDAKTFTGLLERTPDQDDEWLYSAAAGEAYRCPPRDLRVSCGTSEGAVNYTETEPIGIQVHEIRVSTVMPTN